MNNDRLISIASQFALEGEIHEISPVGEGFINDTYRIHTGSGTPDYILQRKNGNIFKDVPAMMENIRKVTGHIRRKVLAAGGNPDREVMRIIPTREGGLCFRDEAGEHWAATLFIDDTITYDRADSPELARKGGIGIGHFQSQLADFDEPLAETIPGFHDIRHRFAQWDLTLARDTANRCRSAAEEIGWIESRREEMLAFWRLVEEGVIPRHVTHNDTKISNILFDRAGNVLCVIDLDTVMNSTSLNDFGDAIRTYANTGAEDDRDLSCVSMSMKMFSAYTDGYLSQHARELSDPEREYLAFAARYITYEQVLRFLMDYLDGDTYYKIRYDDHNLIRARAQYRLLQSMEEQYDAMRETVRRLTKQYEETKH